MFIDASHSHEVELIKHLSTHTYTNAQWYNQYNKDQQSTT